MSAEDNIKDLNNKQQAFCRQYIIDWNGTRAYMHVYPDSSKEAAESSASRLLTNAKVKEYIEEIKNNLEEQAGISKLRVLMEFTKIAFSNLDEYNNTWVSRKEWDKIPDEAKAAIAEVQTDYIKGDTWDKTQVKIKLYDKQKALENISKLMGYNNPEESNVKLVAQITGMQIK
jgi:phage terminase small subunit